MKIALVHEFLNQLGGAERVLQNFLEIWPDATIHTILYNKDKTHGVFEKYEKKISLLNTFPLAKKYPKFLLPWMPAAIESFDFSSYNVVLSDSSSFAHGANAKDKLHICYCHTPARFLWTESREYIEEQKYFFVFKWIAKLFIPGLKKWDYKTSKRPFYMIANSENVSKRIKKYFNRESIALFPPIDTELFHPVGEKKDYFFTVTRLEPYKKTRLLVEVFNELGLPLKIAGTGSDLEYLKKAAKGNIEFLGRISDEDLRKRYSESLAFIFPAEEDAGMTVVESMSCATPVIAYRAGGALETVKEGVTGEFFDQQTPESLKQAIMTFVSSKYNPTTLREHAKQFDKKIFQEKIKKIVDDKYKEFYANRN